MEIVAPWNEITRQKKVEAKNKREKKRKSEKLTSYRK